MKTRKTRRSSFWGREVMAGLLWVAMAALPAVMNAKGPFDLTLSSDFNGTITSPTNVAAGGYIDFGVISAAGTNVVAVPAPGYVFSYWEDQSGLGLAVFSPNSTSTSIVISCKGAASVTNEIDLLAHFVPQPVAPVTLTVVSTNGWGNPVPAVGVQTMSNGSNVMASVTSPVSIGGGSTAICTGFVGSGSVPANGSATFVNFQITANSTITWLWSVLPNSVPLTIISTNSNGVQVGNPVPPQGINNLGYNTQVLAKVTSPWTVSAGEQDTVVGYTGTGSAPSGLGSAASSFYLTQNSTLSWNWNAQYLLTVVVNGNGTVIPTPGGTPVGTPITGYWFPAGTVVSLTAINGTDQFIQWGGNISGYTTANSVIMTNVQTISATFGSKVLDSDNDGLPDAWEVNYGLDPTNALGVSGASGDPDNDGLANNQEYKISYVVLTNGAGNAFVSSPINCDSDGDGLDDGYEFYHIGIVGTNTPDPVANAQAVVNTHGAYGVGGNPDGDFKWNTLTGYQDFGSPLTTSMEYIGPDGLPPGVWGAGLIVTVPGVAKPVIRYRNEADALFPATTGDTADQSFSDTTDTDGDGFDDGFEYTWDVWQGLNGGNAVGDPLGHKVPLRSRAVPELPTAALLAPWFHAGTFTNDMAVCTYNYNRVNFFNNTGAGSFTATSSIPVDACPIAMAVGAFSNAAKAIDIVVACQSNDSICVLLRTPSNAVPFSVKSYPVGHLPSFVVVGNFNGDGFQDIAVANSGDGTVTVLTNNGTGVFGLMTMINVGAGTAPSSLAAGRVFGGITNNPATKFSDLLVADGVGKVYAYKNTAGTFALAGTTTVGSLPTSIVIGDFDQDNINDFAVALGGLGVVRTYLGDGTGAFVQKSEASAGGGGYPVHLAEGLLNAGTTPDLVASAYSNLTGRVYLDAGDGSITPSTTVSLNLHPVWSVIGDVNQDGTNDIVFVCRDEDQVVIYTGNNNGTFNYLASYGSSSVPVGRIFNPALAHMSPPGNGSPDYDLVYLQAGGVGNWWSDQDEYGAWGTNRLSYADKSMTNVIVGGSAATPRSTHPFLWDFDGDGLPDGWEVQFGYDPWKGTSFGGAINDGNLNPDLDGHAVLNKLQDNAVYNFGWPYPNGDPWAANGNTYKNFNPNAGWLDPLIKPRVGQLTQSAAYVNKLEVLGGRAQAATIPFDPNDQSSNPFLRDTDLDGVWDGWELYVGMNPINGTDGLLDTDQDGLLAWQEFMCLDTLLAEPSWTMDANGNVQVPGTLSPVVQASIQARVKYVAGWPNKIRPTDPADFDTDDDQLHDGQEMAPFNYSAGKGAQTVIADTGDPTVAVGAVTQGGGLNPTSVDTDMDCLPDLWEQMYAGALNTSGVWAGGMDGTTPDAFLDYDGDGLLNYQEYMTSAVYNWQYEYNNGSPSWIYGKGLNGYDPFDFFDDRLSATAGHANGDAMAGPGGRRPKYWDQHFWTNAKLLKPFNFITASEPIKPRTPYLFSSTDPRLADSDLDGMDDYWEIYHMLNPIYDGTLNPISQDLVLNKTLTPRLSLFPDFIDFPWLIGDVAMDADQDGLPNIFESVQGQSPNPPYYHTDPSPYWLSDWSYNQSWSDLYYWTGAYFGKQAYWYWDGGVIASFAPPLGPLYAPDYMFDFKSNEGFDTDNDNIPDRDELVGTATSPGATDPLDSDSPIKHRALYLNGLAASRTYGPTTQNHQSWAQLREFTVEAWVRPQNPVSGTEQVIVERPGFLPDGNILGYPSGIRLNFRLGLNASGVPFVAYTGSGFDPIFEIATASINNPLPANQWTHLAGVYDGTAKELILYVNGFVAAMEPTAEIPCNMFFGGYPGNPNLTEPQFIAGAPMVIGARENNPAGWVDGVTFNVTVSPIVGPWAGYNVFRQDPALDHYFKGWVDEVHVFSGPTSQAAIRGRMKTRWTHKAAWAYNVAAGGWASPTALMYAYSFDDLPDPNHDPVAPAGFGLLTFSPGYTGIPFWQSAPDVSLVYTDYRYLKWMQNVVDHVPLNPPEDTSIKWDALTNNFPNSSNPYTFDYHTSTEWHTQLHPKGTGSTVAPSDLLPLRWAVGDQDVEQFDSPNAGNVYSTPGDGIPDDWRIAHGLDPLNPTGNSSALGDPDGDGLNNLYEYLSGTDPWALDSTGDGILDGDKDADGDGLSNLREQQLGTMPNMKDTDDDGLTDWEEVNGAVDPTYNYPERATNTPVAVNSTDPLNPLSPALARSVYLNGNARLIVPPSDKLMSRDWTVEAWVKPEAVTNIAGGVLVSRYVQGLTPADYSINYEVGIETNVTVAPYRVVSTNTSGAVVTNLAGTVRPYVRYLISTNGTVFETRVDGLQPNEHSLGLQQVTIPIGTWTHVAGVYNSASNLLSVYVNGKLASYRTDGSHLPALVYGYGLDHSRDEVTIGASRSTPAGIVTNGYRGWIDEVRIWAGVRSDSDIANNYNGPLQSSAAQSTAGKAYSELAADERSKADALLAQAQALAVAGGNKYTVGYSPVLLRPLNNLCGRLSDPAAYPPPDPAHIAPATVSALGLPASFSWVAKNGVTPVKDQGQCGACWAFATVGCFESALKIATGQDYDLSEQYLVSCNLDGYSCNGGLSAHKYHYDTAAADGKFGGVYETDDPYTATDTAPCGGPYKRPFVLKDWAFVGTGDGDLTIPDAKIKQAIFDHGPVMVGVYVGNAFQAYVGGIFNTSESQPGGHGNHAVLLVGWDDAGGYWIMKNQWGVGWGEAGYMRIAYGTSGIGEGASYVDYNAPVTGGSLPLAEFRFDDGGKTAQDFQVPNDWYNSKNLQVWGSAAILDGAIFETNSVNTAPLDKDSDSDGLPDWWEMAYGLNPYDATGDNGGNGDPDGDGLCNAAEYLAGTDPLRFDTRKLGHSDFYDWNTPNGTYTNCYRIFGELYTDHDGMDDWWEQTHGMDPRLYDAQLDPDQDGWSNLAEFQDGSDPQSSSNYPIPVVTFKMQYAGLSAAGNLIINAYSTPTMDGRPDAVFDMAAIPFVQVNGEQELPGLAGSLAFGNVVPGSLTITVTGAGAGTFVDNGKGVLVGSVAGTSGTIDYVTGGWTLTMAAGVMPLTVTATYRYRQTATTYPMSLTFANVKAGYLKEGNAWFFAFIDLNGNGTWDTGEPAGVAQYQPIDVRRGAFTVEIGLTDSLPGYDRMAWTAQPGQTVYPVQITDMSSGRVLTTLSVRSPRTYLQEQDYRLAGLIGLPFSSLSLQVMGSDGMTPIASDTFDASYYPASPATPQCVYPVGGPLHYALNEFVWTMDTNATSFELVIRPTSVSTTPLLDVTNIPTFRQADGTTHFRLPIYAGDGAFTNGLYYWQVRSINPRANSAFSSWSTFTVDLTDQPQGPWSIQGDVVYPGKVTNSNWIVQAYPSAGFGGAPVSRCVIKNVVTTNAWPLNRMHYALRGLPAGTYYVRAFLDQNGNGTRDVWETSGFQASSFYVPGGVTVPSSATSKDVYTMFADTDNDKLADDWEYEIFTNLTTAGPGPVHGYTAVPWLPGVSVYDFYASSALDANPNDPNSVGTDGLPLRLKDALGLDVWAPYVFSIAGMQEDAGGRAEVTWPALSGNGVTAADVGSTASIAASNGMTLHYQLQYTDDLVTWQDVPAQGSVSFDAVARLLRFTDSPQQSPHHYYRYRVWTE